MRWNPLVGRLTSIALGGSVNSPYHLAGDKSLSENIR